jgi:hypothetical protein
MLLVERSTCCAGCALHSAVAAWPRRCLYHLQDCQLSVVKPNPRQYVARISQLPDLEVWFQRATGEAGTRVRARCAVQSAAIHAALLGGGYTGQPSRQMSTRMHRAL